MCMMVVEGLLEFKTLNFLIQFHNKTFTFGYNPRLQRLKSLSITASYIKKQKLKLIKVDWLFI